MRGWKAPNFAVRYVFNFLAETQKYYSSVPSAKINIKIQVNATDIMAKLLMERIFCYCPISFLNKLSIILTLWNDTKYSDFAHILGYFHGQIEYFLRFRAKTRYVSRLEGHLRLTLKTSKPIQKKSHHQKFLHIISFIILHLYIHLRSLYGEVVFPLKSWLHIIRQNFVLFTFRFVLGFPLKSEID